MKFSKRKIHTLIEYQYNKHTRQYDEVTDEFYFYDGEFSLAGGTPTLEAADWAFYNDGTESGSVIIGTKNTNQTLDTDTIYFYRQGLEETAGNNARNQTAQLQYNHNGGGFVNVTATSSVIQSVATANITDGADTTQRITAFTFDSTNESFDEVDGIAGGGTTDLASNGTEYLFSFQILSADVADTDTIVLKIVNPLDANADFDIYQQTNPTITVNEPVAPVNYERTLTSEVDAQDQQQAYEDKLRQLLSSIDADDSIIRNIITAGQTFERFLSSNIDSTDALLKEVSCNRLLVSNTDVYDLLTRGIFTTLIRNLSSNVDVNDFTTRDALLNRLVISSVNPTDAALVEKLANRLLTSPSIDLTDAISAFVGKEVYSILTSSVNVTDALIVGTLATRSLVNTINAIDSLVISANAYRELASSLDITDFLQSAIITEIVRTLTSNINTTDTVSVEKELFRVLTSIFNISDAVIRNILAGAVEYERVLADNINLVDIIVRTLLEAPAIRERLLSDNTVITDDILTEFLQAGAVVELIKLALEHQNINLDIEKEVIDAGIELQDINLDVDTLR